MAEIEFNGERYNDDRMFVLYICRCTVRVSDEYEITAIYHEDAPKESHWCLITFKNVSRYIAHRVDHFETRREAEIYAAHIEPQTPLISMGGESPTNPIAITDYLKWKHENKFQEYDYKKMFPQGVKNPQENIYVNKE
ncbi:MAG: hypothetical protein KUF72_00405 [Candidatus Thiodiazotropha sp. (ex Ctena orbiculata)]|nr:hypothetical protein [Candidatus Thiodiazotropha taylori]